MIPYGRQSITEEDIEAVVRVLRSDFLTCGPEVEAFEREFATTVGARHAVSVCNATAALHLAMRVIGVGDGDRVVTSPNTFLASANCAAYVNAIPDFSDIDPISHNLDPDVLEANWREDTKAVVAVDYAGQPCNMPGIARVARSRGAYVIEDACHGVGGGFSAEGKAWKLGGHPWADVTVFSFHPVKSMTTGEGGMLVTDNDEWAAKARLLRSHGVTRNPADFVGFADPQGSGSISQVSDVGPWHYEMQELGYNYRMTDLQCALGRSQLRQLPSFVQRRQEIVAQYNESFADLDWLKTPALDSRPSTLDPSSSFRFQLSDLSLHLYTVEMDFGRIGKSRRGVMSGLKNKGVGSQVLYIPVYLQPWYRRTCGYGPGKCPFAEKFYESALSLPLFPAMTDADVEQVISAVKAIVIPAAS